jgi:hypothetical protein
MSPQMALRRGGGGQTIVGVRRLTLKARRVILEERVQHPIRIAFGVALASCLGFGANLSVAPPLTGAPASPEFKFSTPTPPGVALPDSVETRFGTLHFFDGVPDQASTDKIYDNLDFQRAVQAYLLTLPVVNQVGNRAGTLAVGPANTTVLIWQQMVDSRTSN